LTWSVFIEDLCDRFGVEHLDDIVEEFNRLEQTESLEMFLDKFEDLNTQMLLRNPILVEYFLVSSFIGGLKEEIRFVVKMFKLTSLRFDIE